jgi:polysaccharide export outer membrane protein
MMGGVANLRARPLMAMLAAMLAVLLSGCVHSGGSQVAYNAPLTAPDTADFTPADVQSTIMPLDMLTITVYQFPDLSGDFQVSLSGNIELPLIGTVVARGKTVDEIQTELKTRYGAKYLNDPNIRVSARNSNPRSITVDGSVQRPGVYPLQGKITLIQAVALAGGPSDLANPKRVVVFRQINGARAAAAFDLTAIRQARADDPVVYGNDIIVVDGSDSKSNFREAVRALPLITLFTLL